MKHFCLIFWLSHDPQWIFGKERKCFKTCCLIKWKSVIRPWHKGRGRSNTLRKEGEQCVGLQSVAISHDPDRSCPVLAMSVNDRGTRACTGPCEQGRAVVPWEITAKRKHPLSRLLLCGTDSFSPTLITHRAYAENQRLSSCNWQVGLKSWNYEIKLGMADWQHYIKGAKGHG